MIAQWDRVNLINLVLVCLAIAITPRILRNSEQTNPAASNQAGRAKILVFQPRHGLLAGTTLKCPQTLDRPARICIVIGEPSPFAQFWGLHRGDVICGTSQRAWPSDAEGLKMCYKDLERGPTTLMVRTPSGKLVGVTRTQQEIHHYAIEQAECVDCFGITVKEE